MAKDYAGVISEVTLPGGSLYQIKDAQARDDIAKLSNAMHFLGICAADTPNPVQDQQYTNVKIGDIVYSKNPTGSQKQLNSGDVIIYKENRGTVSDPDYVPLEFVFDGDVWQLLGEQSFDNLGDLAFADTATGSAEPSGEVTGSVTLSSSALNASTIPVTFSTTSTTGATLINGVSSTKSIDYVTGFDGEFTFSGSSTTINVTGAATQEDVSIDVVKNNATTLSLQSPLTGGTSLVYGISTSTDSVPKTFSSATVYGASESTTVVTGQQAISASTATFATSSTTFATTANTISMTVVSENLSFTIGDGSVTPTWATGAALTSATTLTDATTKALSSYSVLTGVSTNATVISGVTPSISGYNVSVPKNTWVESGTVDINATVAASTSYTPEGAIVVPTVTSSTATVLNGLSSFYGTVSAYAGGNHTHDIDSSGLGVSIGTVTITVEPDA